MAIQQGVHDITNDEYHASEGLSRSALMSFRKTPYHYWNEYLNPERPAKKEASPALTFGNLLHTYILEPDKILERYIVVKKIDRRTKEGKMYWDELELTKGNREIITEEVFAEAEKIAESVTKHDQARELITGAQFEKSIYWNDPHTGLLCKARPDIWHVNMVCDLKSTMNAGAREFQNSLYQYGYYIQAGMICEALRHVLDVDIRNFIFIALEKEFPYAHAIYKLDELALEQGIAVFKNTLLKIKECVDKNEWPSYETQIITLPAYATL
jgi:exodeoxyribonuclease VIII